MSLYVIESGRIIWTVSPAPQQIAHVAMDGLREQLWIVFFDPIITFDAVTRSAQIEQRIRLGSKEQSQIGKVGFSLIILFREKMITTRMKLRDFRPQPTDRNGSDAAFGTRQFDLSAIWITHSKGTCHTHAIYP